MNYIQAIRNLGQKIHKIKQANVLGKLNDEQYLVSIIKQKTNVNENASHNYQDIYILDQQFKLLSQGDITISNTFTSYNQDKTRFVKLQTLQEDNKPKQVIEIYKNGNLEQSIKQEFHDDILNNVIVGEPFSWNKSGDKLLYIARSKPDQAKTFFTISKEDELDQGWNYRKYKQSWGEQMDNVYGTNIYLLNLQNSKVYQVVTDKYLLQAYPQFDANDNIIFQGYKEAPEFRYGIIHCFNRPSNIYLLKDPILIDLANKEKQLQEHQFQGVIISNDDVSIKPKISPDYKKLIYFGTPLNIQHLSYLALKILDLDTQEIKELVPIIHENLLLNVRNNKQHRDKIFNGICGYYEHLQGTQWTKDSNHFIFSSLVFAQSQIYSVNVNNGQLQNLTHIKPSENTHNSNYINYDQDNDILFYTDEDTMNAPQVHAIKQLSHKLNNQQQLESVSIETNKIQFKEDVVFHDEAEGFVWQLQAPLEDIGIPTYFGEDRPLALILHGGPHGATQGDYKIFRELLLRQGFILLAPNFSGSASYGQKFIEKLSGQIGIPDTIEILNMVKQVGCKRAFVIGGSYGGYLSAFMAAHHPDKFKLAIIMNPAMNFPFMVNSTDIPEWCGSSILNKKFSWNLSKEDYIQLYEKSVIKEHIKIPSLLLLGQKDTRVPYQQSLALRAQTIFNGVDIQTYVYPEADHSLGDSINTGYDVIAKSIIFISKNI